MKKIKKNLQTIIELILLVLLIGIGVFYNCEPVNKFIKDSLYDGKDDVEIMVSLYGIVAASIVALIMKLNRQFNKLNDAIKDSPAGIDDKIFYKGTIGIYDDVGREIELMRDSKKLVEIDVLGFTLFSIKGKFALWKEERKLSKMVFNLHYISPDYITTCPGNISEYWKNDIGSYVGEIERFKKDNETYLKENSVEINLYPIHHLPAIHGFKLHGRSIYLSFSYWDENFLLKNPADSSTYIKIEETDSSSYAQY